MSLKDRGLITSAMKSSGPYVTFTSTTAMTVTPVYTNSGVTLEYSVDDGDTWTTIASEATTPSSSVILMRGAATGTKSLFIESSVISNIWTFTSATDLEAIGNLNYLLCDTIGGEPATTLADYCYSYMFRSCTSLITPPELPATTLADYCYNNMFLSCSSLATAPELPATTLASRCYNDMFYNCTSLITVPELPATTLVDYCYKSMFYNCSSFKVSVTQTGSYQYAWRIPTTGSGTIATDWNTNMLVDTGGTFTADPTIDTTYYVENPPV